MHTFILKNVSIPRVAFLLDNVKLFFYEPSGCIVGLGKNVQLTFGDLFLELMSDLNWYHKAHTANFKNILLIVYQFAETSSCLLKKIIERCSRKKDLTMFAQNGFWWLKIFCTNIVVSIVSLLQNKIITGKVFSHKSVGI